MDSVMSWIAQYLEDGVCTCDSDPDFINEETKLGDAPREIRKDALFQSYLAQKETRFRHKHSKVRFFKALYDNLQLDSKTCCVRRGRGKTRYLILPSLETCRQRFAHAMDDPSWFDETIASEKSAVNARF